MGLGEWWQKLTGQSDSALRPARVECDDQTVCCHHPDGVVQRITWPELSEVVIVTTDQGPFQDDVFWILHGAAGVCVVPSEAEGADELVRRLLTLPGMDQEQVIAAMGSAANQRFVCWRRPA